MKTLFANNENNLFESFEVLTAEELNMVKGGKSKDFDMIVEKVN